MDSRPKIERREARTRLLGIIKKQRNSVLHLPENLIRNLCQVTFVNKMYYYMAR